LCALAFLLLLSVDAHACSDHATTDRKDRVDAPVSNVNPISAEHRGVGPTWR
jgi:hypothetical protein